MSPATNVSEPPKNFSELAPPGKTVYVTGPGRMVEQRNMEAGAVLDEATAAELHRSITNELTHPDSNTSTPEVASSIYTVRCHEADPDTATAEVHRASELAAGNERFVATSSALYDKMLSSANNKGYNGKIPGLTDKNGRTMSREDFATDLAYVALEELRTSKAQGADLATLALTSEDPEEAAQAFDRLLKEAFAREQELNPDFIAGKVPEGKRLPDAYTFKREPTEETMMSTMFRVVSKAYARSGRVLEWNSGVSAMVVLRNEAVVETFREDETDKPVETPAKVVDPAKPAEGDKPADGTDKPKDGDKPANGGAPNAAPTGEHTATPEAETTPDTRSTWERLTDGLRENHRGIITAAAILAAAGGAAYEVGRHRNPDQNVVVTRLMQAGAFAGVALAGGMAARMIGNRIDRTEDETAREKQRSTVAYTMGASAVFFVASELYANWQRKAKATGTATGEAGPATPNTNPLDPEQIHTGIDAIDRFINQISGQSKALENNRETRDAEMQAMDVQNRSRDRIQSLIRVIDRTNAVDENLSIVDRMQGAVKKFMTDTLEVKGVPLAILSTLIDTTIATATAAERVENLATIALSVARIADMVGAADNGAQVAIGITRELGNYMFMTPQRRVIAERERDARIQGMVEAWDAQAAGEVAKAQEPAVVADAAVPVDGSVPDAQPVPAAVQAEAVSPVGTRSKEEVIADILRFEPTANPAELNGLTEQQLSERLEPLLAARFG